MGRLYEQITTNCKIELTFDKLKEMPASLEETKSMIQKVIQTVSAIEINLFDKIFGNDDLKD